MRYGIIVKVVAVNGKLLSKECIQVSALAHEEVLEMDGDDTFNQQCGDTY